MNERTRNALTIGLLILLAVSSFAAGYFTNSLVALRGSSVFAREKDEFDVFWEAWNYADTYFIGERPTAQQVTYGAIRGALATLDDPYTVFIEPVVRVHEQEMLQGTFGGIGAYLSRPEEGADIVLEPIPGNPAEKAGILSGDILVAVDGEPITPQMSVSDIVNLIKGEKGTAVTLTVIHPDTSEPVDIEVERDSILIPSVESRLLEQDETIGYIRLSRFSGESGQEIESALRELQEAGAEKFILDLRGNGGGLLDAAVDVADHFVEDGVLLYQQKAGEDERTFKASSETVAADAPLIVLVDGGTASAAEIVAGALQDRDRAELVGSKTYGKGSVQLVFDLQDGSSVHVTSARWFTPNRNQIDQIGLQPDVAVEITQEAIDNGLDVVLNQAIELLNNE